MLKIDLTGKRAFIAGVADDKGFGFAIAKALAEAGAEILIGTWTPMYRIFLKTIESGKLDESLLLSNGELMKFTKVYPLDASFDIPSEVTEDVKENKRFKEEKN